MASSKIMFCSWLIVGQRPCTLLRHSSKTRLRVKSSDSAWKAWSTAESFQSIILSTIYSLMITSTHFTDNPLILPSESFTSKLYVHLLVCVIEEGAHNPSVYVRCATIPCTYCSHGNGN